jgi:hypothetical protein
MNRYRLPQWASWRRLSFALIALLSAGWLLLIHLKSLAPQLSPGEAATLASSSHLSTIGLDPLNAPLKLLEWLRRFTPSSHLIFFDRLPSVILAFVGLALFVYILRRWYGPRSTVFGFFLLVASAWFLHISRFAGVDIEYTVGTLGLLAAHVALDDAEGRPALFYIWLVTNVVLLFIPGFIWFVLLNAYWQKDELFGAWQKLQSIWQRVSWIAIAVLSLASLAYSFVRTSHLALTWLGMPASFSSPLTILKQLADALLAIIYRGPQDPQLWLGRLPMLDAFGLIMLVAGIIFYAQHWQANRTRLLLSYFLLAILLVGIGGIVRLSIVLPLLYFVIVAGIAYLLHFWLNVFPINPLARRAGIGLVVVLIALSCVYNLEQYFVAWPHNPETVAVYDRISP